MRATVPRDNPRIRVSPWAGTTLYLVMYLVASRRNSEAGSTLRVMFINGEWVEATSGQRFEVTNPATGEVIDTVPDGGADDARAAVAAADAAFGLMVPNNGVRAR